MRCGAEQCRSTRVTRSHWGSTVTHPSAVTRGSEVKRGSSIDDDSEDVRGYSRVGAVAVAAAAAPPSSAAPRRSGPVLSSAASTPSSKQQQQQQQHHPSHTRTPTTSALSQATLSLSLPHPAAPPQAKLLPSIISPLSAASHSHSASTDDTINTPSATKSLTLPLSTTTM